MNALADFGALLAGGAGSRFGGLDKATISLGGAPLWQWARQRLATQVREMVVVAPRKPLWIDDDPTDLWLPDARPTQSDGSWGPAGAILAAVEHARNVAGEDALVLTCPIDSPFLPSDLMSQLTSGLTAGRASVAIAEHLDRPQAVFGLWRAACAGDLRALLERDGAVALHRAATELGAERVAGWTDAAGNPFFNINDAEGLAEAERMVASGETGGGRPS